MCFLQETNQAPGNQNIKKYINPGRWTFLSFIFEQVNLNKS